MKAPKIIFIDTCIFDSYAYNFESQDLKALFEKASDSELSLLMPDPTIQEIYRHIAERGQNVLKAFKAAQKEAPMITKWDFWPDRDKKPEVVNELIKLTRQQLSEFLVALSVKYLDYKGINASEIMNWHTKRKPPFSLSKQEEFPDAFAIASLLVYSKKNQCSIAVISTDGDFEAACKENDRLVYYPSVAKYISGLDAEDLTILKVTHLVEQNGIPNLEELVKNEFMELQFVQWEDDNADIDDIQVQGVNIDEFAVLTYDNNECSISADLEVHYSAHVRMGDPDSVSKDSDSREFFFRHHLAGRVSEFASVRAVIRCELAPDLSKIVSTRSFTIVDDLISVGSRPSDFEPEDYL